MRREAHAHIAAHGRSLAMVSLAGCSGADDCLAIMKDASRRLSAAQDPGWLLAIGARVEGWKQRGAGPSGWPTLRELDEATGDRPCAAMSFDHHMVMANSAALRAAGITRDSPDPPGGIIGRDLHSNPDGLALESAAWALWHAAPEPTAAQRRDHVISALKDLARHGFDEVHDMLSEPWLGPLLAELHDSGELPIRAWLYAPLHDIESRVREAPAWSRPTITLAGAKIFTDGTLNSRTAWMLCPYQEPQHGLPTGKVVTDPAGIEAAIRATARFGIGLAAHAIGDAAVRAVLDATDRVHGSWSADRHTRTTPFRPARDRIEAGVPAVRIEHAEIVDNSDTPRFAELGVVASVQPCHLLADIEALHRYLPHRLDRVLPLRELIDRGCSPGELLWFGSDTPIVRPDPQDSIQAAVHRRRNGTPRTDAIAYPQAILPNEAWAAFEIPAPRR